MPLDLIMGCMFSGKTSELIRRLNIEATVKKKSTIYVNSSIDVRQTTSHSTHNKTMANKLPFKTSKTNSLTSILHVLIKFKVVGIDEAHFFDDLHEVVTALHKCKIHVIVAGLNGDKNQETFGQLHLLIPRATNITFRKAICMICHQPATYSYALKLSDSQTDVGGDDKYQARCETCFAE